MKIRLMEAATLGWIALAIAIPAQAQSGCVKQVFNKYCLGGSLQPVLSKQAASRTNQKGAATIYVFTDGADQTNVTVVKGKIASVARQYFPGTQQTFDQLRGDLKAIYGEPQRIVGSGKSEGRITDLWDQGSWRVSLVWNANKEIRLFYQHEGLQATRRKADAAAAHAISNPKGY